MKKIFILNGYAQSGKDTFVSLVSKNLNKPVANISSIGEIRAIALTYFGWDGGTKDTRTRQLLSDLKNLQTEYCDGPFKFMCANIENSNYEVGFVHIREISEIKKMKEHYPDATTVLIYRPDFEKDVFTDIYNYRYDAVITNEGTLKDFEMAAKRFIFDYGLDKL